MNVTIPACWPALLATNLKWAKAKPENPRAWDTSEGLDDPTPYRGDRRVLVITPDPETPEVWIEIRMISTDLAYWCELVVLDDGHEVEAHLIDPTDKQVVVGLPGFLACTLELIWPKEPVPCPEPASPSGLLWRS